MCLGVILSIQAEVWLAHSVSPIWSGGIFFITGLVGILCAKRKTSYVIMCFIAIAAVSMVTTFVSFQLLRVGLQNHATDGSTFQKEVKDPLIIIAMGTAGVECLICILSILLSCRVAKIAKEEMCQQREGMFHIKDNGSPFTFTNIQDNFSSLEESGIDLSTEDPGVGELDHPSVLCTGRGQHYQSYDSSATTYMDSGGSSPASIPVIKINTPELENSNSGCDSNNGVDGSNIYLEIKQ